MEPRRIALGLSVARRDFRWHQSSDGVFRFSSLVLGGKVDLLSLVDESAAAGLPERVLVRIYPVALRLAAKISQGPGRRTTSNSGEKDRISR